MDDQIKRQLHVGVGMDVSDTAGGLDKIIESVNSFNKGSKDLATGMAEIENSVKKVLVQQGLFSTKTNEATKSASSFAKNIKNEYDIGVKSAVSSLKELEDQYSKLQKQYAENKSNNKDTTKIVAEMKEVYNAKNKIKQQEKKIQDEVEKHVNNSEKNITSTAKAESQKQVTIEKARATSLKQMADDVYNNEKTNLTQLTAKYKQASQERIASSKAVGKAFGDSGNNLNGQLFNTAVQISGVRALTNEFENLGRAIIDINYNTINNQRLMGDFSSGLRDELNNGAAEIAKSTGILITDAQEIQGAWIRINDEYAKSPKLLQEMSDITAKFMSVGEIENAEDAVKLLNSSLLQFNLTGKDVAKNAELIANKFAYMADVTAMGTADEYAESISQIGANIKNMNGDIDDAIALTSIVGDKLAKNGSEAGAAIKTFTSYMQRDQTLDLMDALAEKWDDQSVKIRQGTKGLKDFQGTITSIAKAYGRLKAEGDDQGALDLVNALGATRRRDAAFAMLDAVSSNDGQNLDYYYQKIDEAVSKGNYLEQQNEVLMTSLKKQFASFVASLQQVGMAFGNSGVLTGANLLIKGLSGLLDMVAKIPQPVVTLISGFVALKTALAGMNKIGEVTGLTEKLWQSLYSGTKAQVESANAVRQSTDAYLNQQKIIYTSASAQDKLTESYQRQLSELTSYESAVAKQNELFANGSINAETYQANLDQLTSAYQRNVSAIAKETSERAGEHNAIKRSEQALKQETQAEMKNTTAKNSKLATLLKQKVSRTAENALQKTGIFLTKEETIADKASAIAKSLVSVFTKSSVAEHGASAVAKTADTIATKILTGAMTGLGLAIGAVKAVVGAFLSPIGLLTAAIGLFTFASSRSEAESRKLEESISELTESITAARDRVQELKDEQARSGLSGTEEKELQFLEQKIELEEKALKIKQQQKNNEDYFENKHVIGDIGGSDNKSENVNDSISDFEDAEKDIERFNARLVEAADKASRLKAELDQANLDPSKATQLNSELNNALQYQEQLTKNLNKANEDMVTSSADVVQAYNDLKTKLDNNDFSGEGKKQAQELLATLEGILPRAQSVIETSENTADSIGGIANATQKLGEQGLDEFIKGINNSRTEINKMDDDIKKLTSGTATRDDLSRMVQEYDGFANMIGKSTQEQVDFIEDLKNKSMSTMSETIQKEINDYSKIKEDLENQLKGFKDNKIDVNSDEVVKANAQLDECNRKLEDLNAYKDIELNINGNLDSLDFSNLQSELQGLVDSSKDLANAQQQLAEGTALSTNELWNLAQQYPELLTQSNLFADGSVAGQKKAIDATLDMKQQEFNSTIEQKQAELEAEQVKLNDVIAIENQQLQLLSDMKVAEANGELQTKEQVQSYLNKFNTLELEKYFNTKDQESDKSKESAENQVHAQNQASGKVVSSANNAGKGVANNLSEGARVMADSIAANAQRSQQSLASIVQAAWNTADALAEAAKGKKGGMVGAMFNVASGVFRGVGNYLGGGSFHGSTYNSVDKTIDGIKKSEWINSKYDSINASIEKNIIRSGQISNAIANLNGFKNAGLGNVSSDYVGSGAADKAAKKAAKDAEKAAKEAEKAAKAAAKAAEEERKAIEQITKSYISNVEAMQDRIAKALKKKYEEEYNERKKLLEKEHNERVKQIQDEIDRLQGNTPQDKKDKLEDLKLKLEKWKKDDSTLGKSKQREYMNQIKDLEKEIKIDDLEDQLEDENKKFDTLIDTENANCDKILGTLTQKMDDEHIYKEANDMIRNGKIQEITDLLTKYDSKWDGWGTLIGQTAGDIIGEQVKVAIANFVDVIKGSITSNGGTYTNGVTGGGGSSSSTSKPSSGSSSSSKPKPKYKATVTITNGTTLWDLAAKYYGDPYKWTKIQKANGNVDPRRLIPGRKLYIPFRSGGYTGEQEGVAMLHKKERVLNAPQTKAFDHLVYDFLPRISKLFGQSSNSITNATTNNNFNKELVNIRVDRVIQNTKTDEANSRDNINRALEKSLKKSGIRLK